MSVDAERGFVLRRVTSCGLYLLAGLLHAQTGCWTGATEESEHRTNFRKQVSCRTRSLLCRPPSPQPQWHHLLRMGRPASSSSSWFLLCSSVAKRLRGRGWGLSGVLSGCCSDLDRFSPGEEYSWRTSWSDKQESARDKRVQLNKWRTCVIYFVWIQTWTKELIIYDLSVLFLPSYFCPYLKKLQNKKVFWCLRQKYFYM